LKPAPCTDGAPSRIDFIPFGRISLGSGPDPIFGRTAHQIQQASSASRLLASDRGRSPRRLCTRMSTRPPQAQLSRTAAGNDHGGDLWSMSRISHGATQPAQWRLAYLASAAARTSGRTDGTPDSRRPYHPTERVRSESERA
jgi:hypothetical protein